MKLGTKLLAAPLCTAVVLLAVSQFEGVLVVAQGERASDAAAAQSAQTPRSAKRG